MKWLQRVKTLRTVFGVGSNLTTEQIVAAGNYVHANAWINSDHFPMRCWRMRKPIFVPMGRNFTYQDALAKLKELGLKPPAYEDALLFGKKRKRRGSVMFPHEPVLGVGGSPVVIELINRDGHLGLELGWTGYGRPADVLVAGVR